MHVPLLCICWAALAQSELPTKKKNKKKNISFSQAQELSGGFIGNLCSWVRFLLLAWAHTLILQLCLLKCKFPSWCNGGGGGSSGGGRAKTCSRRMGEGCEGEWKPVGPGGAGTIGGICGGWRGGSLIGSMWLSDTLGCWAPQRISKLGMETKGDGVIRRMPVRCHDVCFTKRFTVN